MSLLPFRDIGTGFPVVLGGSYLWDATMWAPQIDALGKRHRLIIPELPGHGNDALLPAGCTTPADLAREAGALLDALGIDRYALVGLSVGGMWAAELALQRPAQVRSLVLMDTSADRGPAIAETVLFPATPVRKPPNALPSAFVNPG